MKILGFLAALAVAGCGPTFSDSDGSGEDTDGEGSSGAGEGSSGGAADDAPADSGSEDGEVAEPPTGLRLVVARLTDDEFSVGGGPGQQAYPVGVDLVDLVDGEVHRTPLLSDVAVEWDGLYRSLGAEISREGWISFAHAEGEQFGEEAAVWTWDARALLPSAPTLGRVLSHDELAIDFGLRAWVIAERLLLLRASGIETTDPAGDAPVSTLSPDGVGVRPVSGTDSIVYSEGEGEDAALMLTDLATDVTTRLDDPDAAGSPVNGHLVAPLGNAVVYVQKAEDVDSLLTVDLDEGAPSPPRLVARLGPDDAGIFGTVEVAPDGDAIVFMHYDTTTSPAASSLYYVELSGDAEPLRLATANFPDVAWSADGATITYRSSSNAFERLDRTTLERTPLDVDFGGDDRWARCGAGLLIERSEPPSRWWTYEGTEISLDDAAGAYKCSADGEFVAYATAAGLYARRLTASGLGDAELIAPLGPDETIDHLRLSPDGTILVYRTCPPRDEAWPPQACPGTLSAWDSTTDENLVLLDDGYLFEPATLASLPSP